MTPVIDSNVRETIAQSLHEISAHLEDVAQNSDYPNRRRILIDWARDLESFAPATWYACHCSFVSPLEKDVDAICPMCHALRKLPPRLDIAIWPLYLKILRLLRDDWFEALRNALHQINAIQTETAGAMICVDGMTIEKSGHIRGIAWIALPIPHLEFS